ncbi:MULTISPECIES: general stress protein [unclassified Leptolyngbya]|uniref:general stress protein n=1 Tax=unclassified Leptolyngbya TaxID=2650499 RepID=UPI001686346E|nr:MULTISPECIES: general stress protein [unclassified Leptolyngbya]MBD1913909.1 hypothetical protein [Leptolyngbya sp. FACHB-8]MBD2156361.1 hypothetical protein [Leptolyngbya sp. FACHB-16]
MVASRSHTTSNRHRRAIGTFPNRRIATQALHELRDSGFPMERVSIITRDRDRKGKLSEIAHETKADDGAALGAAAGGALGTLAGLLVGLGSLAIPGIGPVMLAGATATTIATTLAGTAIGAVTGSLLGALVGLGIPEEEAKDYHDRIVRGEYLIMVEGTDREIAQAEYILHRRGIAAYRIYDMPASAAASTTPAVTAPVQHHSMQTQPFLPRPIQRYGTIAVGRSKHGITTFPNDQIAGGAIAALGQAGFPLTNLSVITRRVEYPNLFVGVDLRDRFETARYGVPTDRAQQYDEQLERGECLVIVSGGEQEIQYAADVLAAYGVTSWQVFDPMRINSTATLGGDARVERPQPAVAEVEPVTNMPPVPPVPPPVPPVLPTPTEVQSETVHSKRTIPTIEVIYTAIAKPAPPPPPAGVVLPPVSTQPQHYRAVGVFYQRRGMESALSELRTIGFPMEQVSLLVKEKNRSSQSVDVDSQPQKGSRASRNTRTNSATPSLDTLLVGMGTLTIPGIGPVIAGGATAMAIAATLVSTSTIGNGDESLVKALMQEGVPENFARVYGDRFHKGNALVIIDGSDASILRAEAILKQHHVHTWETFGANYPRTNVMPPSEANPDGLLPQHPEPYSNKRLGIEERAQSVRGIDGSESYWNDQGDRPQTVKKVITPMPEVIMIDHRNQAQ